MNNKDIKIAIADDHKLVRNGIANLLLSRDFDVIYQCENGKEMYEYALKNDVDVVIMDMNMPVMNGWEATAALQKDKPSVKVIGLSMLDDDLSVVKIIRAGARGYLLKDAEPAELVRAIHDVYKNGFYHSDFVSGYLYKSFSGQDGEGHVLELLSDREMEFLKLCCTEYTYKEIANKMSVSPRTVDGYRDALFTKLESRSRVGLVMSAIKHHIVEL
ncbi:response regulator transcription factor [Cryomorpha ignava]|uniref:Response regulator transcription factor n=1 Tax=Cryomorpha ignava TaxID=101383 RepID=A0A7K3WPR8_9FLAO|nr:response regulator transcription factor [Cryomorpha ignava]NEN23653.1 response regulator transcription factor [Cryomorpha ignava]